VISSGVSDPSAIAVDGNNDLFVANDGNLEVREFAAPYGSPTASMSVPCYPSSLATDAYNDVYMSLRTCNEVYVYAPPYTGSPVVIAATAPSYVTIGPNGDLFVINNLNGGANSISVFTPPFSSSSTPAQTISVDLDGSNAMVVNSIGQLFVTNGTTDEVNVYPAALHRLRVGTVLDRLRVGGDVQQPVRDRDRRGRRRLRHQRQRRLP
jgi:hypothetical protein